MMRHIHNALIATAVIGVGALIASTADAQYYYGPYGHYRSPLGGRYYTYGADRSNPSFGPHSFDQDNPRDFQLQGHD
jgi:hypothetical protein